MSQSCENRIALTATIEALTGKAAELETRVNDLHRAIAEVNEQMLSVSDALHRLARSGVDATAVEE
ncbi:hypothetical protein AB0O67_23330 [Streptomyces sp. NPDC086077]|uniref:hypothetical protein n=1 Tax=Streptomyces sp. NPDC086077 TaxID=3154862 RepID=UPI003441A317